MKRNRDRVEAIYMITVAQLMQEKVKEKTERKMETTEKL